MANLNESSSDSPAEIYERLMVPGIFGPWSADLLERVNLQPGERLLDVACGTGIVSRQAAPFVGDTGRVVGLDMNAGILDKARSFDTLIDWREGDATNMPFSDHEFDVVVCHHGIQQIPDRSKSVAEMHRVLQPGRRLGAAMWCSIEGSPGYLSLRQALERHVGVTAAEAMDQPLCFGEAGPVQALLEEAGFRDVDVKRVSRMTHFTSPGEFTRAILVGGVMRRTGTQFSEETIQLLIDDVSSDLQSYVSADGLSVPMESHLTTARK